MTKDMDFHQVRFPGPLELYSRPDLKTLDRVAADLAGCAVERITAQKVKASDFSKGVSPNGRAYDITCDVVREFLCQPNPGLAYFDADAQYEDLRDSVIATTRKRISEVRARKNYTHTLLIYMKGKLQKRVSAKG